MTVSSPITKMRASFTRARPAIKVLSAGFIVLLVVGLMRMRQARSAFRSYRTRTVFSSPQCLRSFRGVRFPGARHDYFLPMGYRRRTSRFFYDTPRAKAVLNNHVYNYAAYLASRRRNSWIIDIGAGSGRKAARIYENSRQRFVLMDIGRNLRLAKTNFAATRRYKRSRGRDVKFTYWDAARTGFPSIEGSVLYGSTIIAADVIQHLSNPDRLVDSMLALMDGCGVQNIIISTPHRAFKDSKGPPKNNFHVREWTVREFAGYLSSRGANVKHCVLTSTKIRSNKQTIATCLISKKYNRLPNKNRMRNYFKLRI